MTTPTEASEKLHELDLRHRDDGDGGYNLVEEVLAYARALSVADRDALKRVLIHLVDCQDATMWGVALEALVQGWGPDAAGPLASLFDHEPRAAEWEGHLLLALLRLRYRGIADKAVAHIARRVSAGDRSVLPLLSALCKVDADAFQRIAVPFLINIIKNGEINKLEGYVPALVNHLVDADRNLLVSLIRAIGEKDGAVASQLRDRISAYLDRPYVFASLGDAEVRSLNQSVRAALGHLN